MSTLAAASLTVMALALSPGDSITVRGIVSTSHDGARFDALEMFDAEAGALRALGRDPTDPTTVRFEATGQQGPACQKVGVASPCLVPRLAPLAHARLLSVDELRTTLRGSFALEIVPRPVPPPPVSRWPRIWAALSIVAGLGIMALLLERRRRATPLGRVQIAAARARRVTKEDLTLQFLREEIVRLEGEAREVERARVSCLATLRRARSVTHAEEQDEVRRLQSDLAAAGTRLDEIAAALRLIPLRVREHRGLAQKLIPGGAMGAVSRELELRDRALDEVDH